MYKEIQNGAVAKSYMTNGLLIYGELFAHFLIYFETLPNICLCNCSIMNFIIYEENFIFFFISVEEKYEGRNYNRDREKVREKAK